MPIVGCYLVDLYCDCRGVCGAGPKDWGPDYGIHCSCHEFKEFPHQFTHEFGSKARTQAKKNGWLLDLKSNKAICPKCMQKIRALIQKKAQTALRKTLKEGD
ncbi:MAG: hypothetical protein Q8K86_11605 [Candidatus Nanopelagicaceae bacterium]|nr:hypothetical protein [Candidatus Nanopelagicaceae bacterium]